MLRAALLALVALAALTGSAQAAPTWLPSTPVSGPMTFDARDIDIAGDGAGAVAAVWSRRFLVEASVRERGGAWGKVQTLYSGSLWPTGARVAMSANGEALAVWIENPTDKPANGTIVRASLRPPGGTFGPAFDVSRPAADAPATAPAVAMAPSGAAVVVWRRGTSIQAVARDSAGGQFGLPDTLSTGSASRDDDPQVVIGASGEATAVWREDDATVVVATRAPRGDWSTDRPWTGTQPSIAADRGGTPVVTWNAQSKLWFARRVAGGWTAPLDLGRDRWWTSLAVDADGTVGAFGSTYEDKPTARLRTPTGQFQEAVVGDSILRNLDYRVGLAAGFTGGLMAYYNAGNNKGVGVAVRPTGGTFGPVMFPADGRWVIARSVAIGDDEGNATVLWEQFENAGWRVTASDYDGAPPTLSDPSIPERVTVGDAAAMSASAFDRLSGATITWQFGDGTDANGAAVSHLYAEPGERVVTVTARDGVGNAVSRSATIEVVPQPVIVTPPRVVIDADGDSFEPPLDCDDTRASVRPGTPEVPGNTIDENCDGVRASYPTVGAAPSLTTLRQAKGVTLLVGLVIRDIDVGDTVRISCSGKGCRKAMKHAQVARKPAKSLDLTRVVKKARLRVGAKVEVRISHPGRITRIFTFVMRSGGNGSPRRVRECQAPEGGARSTC